MSISFFYEVHYVSKTHFCYSCSRIKARLLLNLYTDMLQEAAFIFVELKLFENEAVAFKSFAGRKSERQATVFGIVVN